MEGSVIDLSEYRLEKAKEDLETAEENLNTIICLFAHMKLRLSYELM